MADKRGINGRALGRLGNPLGSVSFDIVADFNGATNANPTVAVLPFPVYLKDVKVIATATNGGGTVRVDNNATAITNAIICASDTVVTGLESGSPTVDDAQWRIAANIPIKLTIAANAAGRIFISLVRA